MLTPYFTLDFLSTALGMVGVVLTLIAYYLLQVGKMSSDTAVYSILNLIGSILILFSLWFHRNLPSTIIELAWVLFSIIGLIRVLKQRPDPINFS